MKEFKSEKQKHSSAVQDTKQVEEKAKFPLTGETVFSASQAQETKASCESSAMCVSSRAVL